MDVLQATYNNLPISVKADSAGNLIVDGSGGGAASPTIAGGEYLSSPPTLTNTQTGPLLFDVNENLKVTQGTLLAGEDLTSNVLGTALKIIAAASYSWTFAVPSTSATGTVKGSPGNAGAFVANILSGTGAFFQIWDGVLGSGTLLWSDWVGAGSGANYTSVSRGAKDWGQNGLFCATSINWGFSSTAATYTGSTPATSLVCFGYK